MLIAYQIMQSKGMLLPDVNPFIQLAVMYPAASWGSTSPDLDHHIGAVKEQTPFNLLVHRVLHLGHVTHRSWQTHSVLATGGGMALLYGLMLIGKKLGLGLSPFDWIIIQLIVTGGIVGVLSHLVLDAFSTAGIHIWPGFKLRFVPKSTMFKTGGTWESIVFVVLIIGIILSVINIVCTSFGIDLISLIKNKL